LVVHALALLSLTLFFSGTSGSFGVPAGDAHEKGQDGAAVDANAKKEDKRSGPSLAVLDSYALERWEVGIKFEPNRQANAFWFADDLALHGIVWEWAEAAGTFSRCPIFAQNKWAHERNAVRSIQSLLRHSELITSPVSSGSLQISSTGFQFLLHSPHEQLWHLLLQYLILAEVGAGEVTLRFLAYHNMIYSYSNGGWTLLRF